MSLALQEEEEDMASESNLFWGKEVAEKETFDEATQPVRDVRPDSPVCSVLSMRTDNSMFTPPNYSEENEPMDFSVRDQTSLVETHFQPECRKRPGTRSRSRDTVCDVCSEGRARAVKYCQTCPAYYCEAHIRLHYTAEALQSHRLEDITEDMECHRVEAEQGEKSRADAQSLHQDGQKQEMMCKSTGIFQKWSRRTGFFGILILFMILWFYDSTPKESGRRPDLRIVLVGKTGAGKSATANTILGREVFKEGFSPKPVTSKCEINSGEVAGRNVTVIDTPGIFGMSRSSDEIKCEMVESISHLFLLVIRLGRFTEEDRTIPKWIQENFGEEALQFTMVLLTGGDELRTPVEEYLRESSGLQELITSCGGGYYVFNNKDKNNRSQVTGLLEKIEAVLFNMTGYHYASLKIQQTQQKIQTEERKKEMIYLANMKAVLMVVLGIILVILGYFVFSEKEISAQEERKREESEREIRKEKKGKREESEREIRAEEKGKREQSEKEIITEEEGKREESEREIRTEEKGKREESEREIRAEEERKMEESEREIRTEEKRKREESEREIRAEEERKREESEREIRAEEEIKREESLREIRAEEEIKREESEREIRAEEVGKREESERDIRAEEERKREESEREIRAEEEIKREESLREIRAEEEIKREESEREITAEEVGKREESER